MNCLVIGGSGLIGSALVNELNASGHDVTAPTRAEFDLGDYRELTHITAAVFFCAGIKGIKPNETDRVRSWRVNVDGSLQFCLLYMRGGCRLVYVSSDAVEWLDTHYTRQKALVEVGLLAAGNPVIVRPSTVTKERAPEFARFMIGLVDKPGIHYWQ